MRSLGHEPSPTGLADVYSGLVDHIVVDHGDVESVAGIDIHPTDIMIGSREQASRLAKEMIEWLT
jgi:hypothetical protein